ALGVTPGTWCVGVRQVEVAREGKLVIYGQFGPWRYVARLNGDGSEDMSFVTPQFTWIVRTILVQPDGKVLVAGTHSGTEGVTPNGILRLNQNGSIDTGFQVPEEVVGHPNDVYDLALRPDGRVLLCKAYNPAARDRARAIVQLQSNGSVDSSFSFRLHPANANVMAILSLPNGRAIIGGHFTRLNDVQRVGLAGLTADGTLDSSFVPPAEPLSWVEVMARQEDGRILVGGSFYSTNPPFSKDLVRLNPNGSLDNSFQLPSGFYGSVRALAVQPDGRILFGGGFSLGGSPSYLARVKPDGSLDDTFEQGTGIAGEDVSIEAIAVQRDGKILVGGTFQTYNGVPRTGLLRLNPNGSLDETFSPPAEIQWAWRIAVQPDGRIVVLSERLLRLLPDGNLDPTFHAPPEVAGFALEPTGKLIVTGSLDMPADRAGASSLMRLNPDGSPDQSFITRLAGGWVNAIVLQADGRVLIGGTFEEVNDIERANIARLSNDPVQIGSFVTRQLPGQHGSPGNTVRLIAQPSASTSVYAVQDQPPAGWAIRNISHGGVFDSATALVKFGPFFDHEPRTLAYDALPPLGFQGVAVFSGAASADGLNSPIVGDHRMVIGPPHPADLNPSDWALRINEITAYAAAWRTGGSWPNPPTPIPIDYVTRAAMLWRVGEGYRIDPNGDAPPRWWIPTNLVSRPVTKDLDGLSSASRALPNAYVPGEPLEVAIAVSPTPSTMSYAVEESIPAGWQVLLPSHGGQLDAIHGQVKWGPFFDCSARTLRYQLLPPVGSAGAVAFAGGASFDGSTALVSGSAAIRAGSRLSWKAQPGSSGLVLQLRAAAGLRYAIEVSEDLVRWSPLATVNNDSGLVEIPIIINSTHPQRYYRAMPVP
ncbi:MAG TPA: hypothetical protein VJA21_26445, partial [Verrucomicrobiae bacterium]